MRGIGLFFVLPFCDAQVRDDMKLGSPIAVTFLLWAAGCTPPDSIPQGVRVYFSPQGGATEAVVNALGQATNAVLVQAYSFTSARIARALVEAHRRGVNVQVILDKSQRTEKYSEADFLIHNDIPTLIDAEHSIAHNKIMVLDGYVVLTGSFNFTKAAEENNAENLLVLNAPTLAKEYIENWHAHERYSETYQPEARTERSAPVLLEPKHRPGRTATPRSERILN